MAFLQVSHDQDAARLSARRGHFFPAKLLDSQFAVLEMPEDSKRIIVVPAHSEPATVVADIMARLGLAADQGPPAGPAGRARPPGQRPPGQPPPGQPPPG